MKRKDGLTSVIKMFLGDVVYKKVREGEDNVLVMKLHWSCPEGMPTLFIFSNRPPRLGSLITKAILKQSEVSAHQ